MSLTGCLCSFDRFRALVVHQFEKSDEVKRSDLVALVQAELKETVSNANYTKVLKELSTSHGYRWIIKSGEGP